METDKVKHHKEICEYLNSIYQVKNNDYGDSFTKVRKEVPNAILVRILDKTNRLVSLLNGTDQLVKDESINDTLMDLANYCIMELVERGIDCEIIHHHNRSGGIYADDKSYFKF